MQGQLARAGEGQDEEEGQRDDDRDAAHDRDRPEPIGAAAQNRVPARVQQRRAEDEGDDQGD